MGTSYNTSIVTNGLIFCVDPGNVKSYPGSGTTLTDISSAKNHALLIQSTSSLSYDPSTKSFHKSVYNANDMFRSTNTVNLSSGFTMFALAQVFELNAGTANGILTNHSHGNNTGAGITIKDISSTDFRISCNTGNGTGRTYNTYYGNTNIYNTWNLLTLRFRKSDNNLSLWVNGVKDYEMTYAMVTQVDYIDLFNWSTSYYTNATYKPRSKIGHASVYNRSLSDAEIFQNFTALRGRYGI